MAFSAFVFDLDGTLLNTLDDLAYACNTMLERHGWPVHPLTSYRQFIGNGFVRLVSRALPKDELEKMDEARLNALIAEGKAIYNESMLCRTVPYDGICSVLKEFAGRGIRLGVVSNKPDAQAQVLIEHFFPSLFAAVHGGRPNVPLKPDPAAVLAALTELGAAKEETAYVGDSSVDMITAANAGLFSIGVSWGFRGEEELRDSGAKAVISRAEELLSFI